jgi:hypothetical protein
MQWKRLKFSLFNWPLIVRTFKCIPNEHFGEEEIVSELTWKSSDVTWKVQSMDEVFRML